MKYEQLGKAIANLLLAGAPPMAIHYHTT